MAVRWIWGSTTLTMWMISIYQLLSLTTLWYRGLSLIYTSAGIVPRYYWKYIHFCRFLQVSLYICILLPKLEDLLQTYQLLSWEDHSLSLNNVGILQDGRAIEEQDNRLHQARQYQLTLYSNFFSSIRFSGCNVIFMVLFL